MKYHEMLQPWAWWGVGAFRENPGAALAALPPALPQDLRGKPPIRLSVGSRGTTRNVVGMSAAISAFCAGLPVAVRPFYLQSLTWANAKADLLALFAAERKAHLGNECGCPAPHREFHLSWMVLARMVAVESRDADLLVETRDHWGRDIALMKVCSNPGGEVWMPGHRDKGAPDHQLSTAFLRRLAIPGALPPSHEASVHPIYRGLLALLAVDNLGAVLRPDLPNLLYPLRIREWPGVVKTIEMDPAAAKDADSPDPVSWTAQWVNDKNDLGRAWPTTPPVPPGRDSMIIVGGSWTGPGVDGATPIGPFKLPTAGATSPPPAPKKVSKPGCALPILGACALLLATLAGLAELVKLIR